VRVYKTLSTAVVQKITLQSLIMPGRPTLRYHRRVGEGAEPPPLNPHSSRRKSRRRQNRNPQTPEPVALNPEPTPSPMQWSWHQNVDLRRGSRTIRDVGSIQAYTALCGWRQASVNYNGQAFRLLAPQGHRNVCSFKSNQPNGPTRPCPKAF